MMKPAFFFVVLALLVPFCLATCDSSIQPTFASADPSGATQCFNGAVEYFCGHGSACDNAGACLTCSGQPVFQFANQAGTACCSDIGFMWGDPHFTGFDGNKFDFMGISNKWFNLLSTESIQINGFFQPSCGFYKGTYVTEIGLLVNGSKVHLTTDSSTLNGEELTCCKGRTPILLNGGALRHQSVDHFEVETSELLVKLTRLSRSIEKDCLKASFNLDFTLKEYVGMIHGVIGQTAHHPLSGNAPEVEGKTEDYVVSGPFSIDSKFSKYNL